MVKVKLKLPPGGTGELNAPWFAVTVWVTLSWFVQVILVPTLTVRLLGLNEKFIIVTLFPPPLVAVVGVGVGVGLAVGVAVGAVVGVVLVPVVAGAPPHAARVSTRPTVKRNSRAVKMVDALCFCIVGALLSFYNTYGGRDFPLLYLHIRHLVTSPARDRTARLLSEESPTKVKSSLRTSWLLTLPGDCSV